MIDLTAYQAQARTTAIYPPELAFHYLIPGLRDEVDEFVDSETGSDAECKEIGDIAWFAVMILDELGTEARFSPRKRRPPFDITDNAKALHHRWVKVVRDRGGVPDGSDKLLIEEKVCAVMDGLIGYVGWRGWALADVLNANLAKLAGRKERETLGGEGDER